MTVKQFAKRAGVSVRALHHYDRLDLLRPARSRSGYRVNREQDLSPQVWLSARHLPLEQFSCPGEFA